MASRRVTYSVSLIGAAGIPCPREEWGKRCGVASLTYQNASGGSEQNTVNLPWSLSFDARPGAFAYISAQNESEEGTITVRLQVDGRLVQEASSNSRFGIASASGSVR